MTVSYLCRWLEVPRRPDLEARVSPAAGTQPSPRLRERNKTDKLRRIQKAAWNLFSQNGFEATTTREIAEAAGVGTGTLFLYARDKSDLLVLAFQDAVAGALDAAEASMPVTRPLADRLLHLFTALFRVFDQDRRLSGEFVKELLVTGRPGREQMTRLTKRTVDMVAEQVEAARLAGETSGVAPVREAALGCFALYYGTMALWLGGWLGENGTPEAHLARGLSRLLQAAGAVPARGSALAAGSSLPVAARRPVAGAPVRAPIAPPTIVVRRSPSRPAIFGPEDGDFID
jgi:TetR/AcrR family transcriptional regulator, cholesterol catabolism regulator